MEGCSKTGAGAVPDLPDGPLVEILSRVPAKTVCRFKCVSKAWRDLIADPDNRKRLRQAMQGLFVQSSRYNEQCIPMSSFSFVDLAVRSVPLEMDPCFSFLAELTSIQSLCLLGSCNGLVLFGDRSTGGYIVCNPTTKQWSTVPACGSPAGYRCRTYTYLAFDPAICYHFHLVQFQKPDLYASIELHVYSSETGTWSGNKIDEEIEQGRLERWHHQFTLDVTTIQPQPQPQCAFVNGFLHLIVSGLNGHHILVVDVQGKARRIINVPHMPNFINYLGHSQGHLHCVTLEYADNKAGKLSTWVLQDYSTQDWVLKNTLELSIFGQSRTRVASEFPEFKVVDIHQDCNVVLFLQCISCISCKLIAYDMDRKEASLIATFNDRKDPWDFARYVPYFSESLALTNKH